MGIKKWIKDFKEDMKVKGEISDIKKKAYIQEMKTQAEVMGKRQAELEAKHREKIYSNKLNETFNKKIKSSNKPVDVFGFNNQKKETGYFNIITGEYGNN